MQILYRGRPVQQLGELGKHLLRAGGHDYDPARLLHRQLKQFVYRPDYPEKNDQVLAGVAAAKVLESGEDGREQLSFLNILFLTTDHQFHVDADYRGLLGWLVKVDSWFGEIMAAVEKSRRREETLVVMISDHGADFSPTLVNYSFPITAWLRQEDFGSHTTLSPHTEDGIHSLTLVVRGIDSAKTYESETSAYGPHVPGGEKGYYTVFTAHAGNPRFDAYLRNNDLNALHLLLLEIKRMRKDSGRIDNLYPAFRKVMERVRPWVESEIRNMSRAADNLAEYARTFPTEDDSSGKDSVRRLLKEVEGYRATAAILQALVTLPVERPSWDRWARGGFDISRIIPKGYLGPRNSLDQLRNYIVGWQLAEDSRWLDGAAKFRILDYPEKFAFYQATNPSAYGERHPFDFFSAAVPLEQLGTDFGRPLKQAVWLKFSAQRGEALLLEAADGTIAYTPVRGMQLEDGRYRFQIDEEQDPMGYGAFSQGPAWLTRRQWADRSGNLDYSVAPVIIADLFRRNFDPVLESAAFRSRTPASIDADGHIEALRFRYAQGICDFRVWMKRGFNVNTQSPTPGASHGGFQPIETQTIFAAWAGERFPLRRGETVTGSFFTQDIMPTLLDMMQVAPPQSPLPLPGAVIPILMNQK
ncbi:MAG: hypothetical protein FJW35_17155 [Acidobacteria bacterium]|nr:hypothetical protein [Acidobacteriota bacterium]